MSTITGLVLTKDGERLLAKCLASLDFCNEILVVDSLSDDATTDIAKNMGARVLERGWEGPGPQFRFALENVSTEWVVSLDQDEFLSPELRGEIIDRLRGDGAPAEDLAGYWVHRRSFYFDRFLKHSGWYPDKLLRVFRAERMQVSVSGAHYSFHPQGRTETIPRDIVHYPYRNFSEHLEKINSYAEQGAASLRARGRRGGLAAGLAHGAARFAKLYLLKLGILDGRAGFINALAGAWYAYQKHLRAAEGSDWGAPHDG